MADDVTLQATTSTVARKLYLTALGLAVVWALGSLGWWALVLHTEPQPPEVGYGVAALVAGGTALGPLAALVTLNRWWRWLRKP